MTQTKINFKLFVLCLFWFMLIVKVLSLLLYVQMCLISIYLVSVNYLSKVMCQNLSIYAVINYMRACWSWKRVKLGLWNKGLMLHISTHSGSKNTTRTCPKKTDIFWRMKQAGYTSFIYFIAEWISIQLQVQSNL